MTQLPKPMTTWNKFAILFAPAGMEMCGGADEEVEEDEEE